jgi:hypothetical protein
MVRRPGPITSSANGAVIRVLRYAVEAGIHGQPEIAADLQPAGSLLHDKPVPKLIIHEFEGRR